MGDPQVGIAADRNSLRLLPNRFTCDLAEFEAALRGAARARSPLEREPLLASAVELYRGEFLHGYHEEWIYPEQTRLAIAYQDALRELADHYEQRGALSAARDVAARLLREDPLDEAACHRLMRLYAATGQRAAALAQYRALERRLLEELDATPGATLRALAREFAAAPRDGASLSAAAATSAPAPPTPGYEHQEPTSGAVPLELAVLRNAPGRSCVQWGDRAARKHSTADRAAPRPARRRCSPAACGERASRAVASC